MVLHKTHVTWKNENHEGNVVIYWMHFQLACEPASSIIHKLNLSETFNSCILNIYEIFQEFSLSGFAIFIQNIKLLLEL